MKREDLLILLSFLLVLEGYLGGNVAPALLGVFLLLYLYGLRLVTRIGVSGERAIEGTKLEEGKAVTAALRLRNTGGDVFVRVREETPGFEAEPVEIFLGSGEEKTVTYSIVPRAKGRFTLRPPRAIALDPRGLYVEEFVLGEGLGVLVRPSIEGIRDAVRADHNLRLAEAYRKGAFLGTESLEIKDLREYQHGDDFKRIDWKATARLGELVVKDFLREENADVYIFLDNTSEMRKGIKRAKIDYASTLALQLAANLVSRFRVGMVIYDDARAELLPPGKGPSQVEAIRERLSIRGKGGAMSMRFEFDIRMGEKAREFLGKVLPLRKGRKGPTGVFEGLSLVKNPSYIIFITDLSNPRELYRAIATAVRAHRVMVLSPNPVLFYSGRLDEKTLERLYRAYVERENLLRKFNLLAPTIDLGPSDYLREIMKLEGWGR
ncbi:DUF58 domain-containing protein [Thermococcus thioreducens]|uniref:Uncharacterized conserved protein, DUF58 family, contains vWF domain n=1 Tax=Thermococcus thioreducens TaxID=277988 RepID=A0A0Q2RD25_9EURY|nr:DUF58 domain-containing protein [Thermococcus thioreducens]ASJ11572.1 hypothetical protein A3L14_01105 [Thermococcus thioreducens]KQH81822.1 hypothetical protein AMR53_08725 [Thermococcus thioreducens]SEW04236.1 Uncharacterized conserved protein, DUF58 family, contains vWF domain [Thermococcus thioreducens]